ncbi:MAG TPA: hypothetical protein O0X70_04685 [Methanocorpusculum sp.]|nr:hypothetical protein [Methanocorpusculum sp.]
MKKLLGILAGLLLVACFVSAGFAAPVDQAAASSSMTTDNAVPIGVAAIPPASGVVAIPPNAGVVAIPPNAGVVASERMDLYPPFSDASGALAIPLDGVIFRLSDDELANPIVSDASGALAIPMQALANPVITAML